MKIGILTHYYKSTNYGGLLQSYALVEYLNKQNVQAEQVRYESTLMSGSLCVKLKRMIKNTLSLAYFTVGQKYYHRKKVMKGFEDSIKHSKKIYSDKDIFQANNEYDAFICGSDQVWNPNVISVGYSLAFTDKPKFSYAASFACEEIPNEKKSFYEDTISCFNMVSVRERSAIPFIDSYCNPILVLDPVFLLSSEEWKRIESEKLVEERYAFCYFLGDEAAPRKLAADYSSKMGLKTVIIDGLFLNKNPDNLMMDYTLHNVDPSMFLSLIDNAECIFTDSFHAIAFSYIFNKIFFVFDRNSSVNMSSRIIDIVKTLKCTDRYLNCDDLLNIEYIEKKAQEGISLDNPIYDELLNESHAFIEGIIKAIM